MATRPQFQKNNPDAERVTVRVLEGVRAGGEGRRPGDVLEVSQDEFQDLVAGRSNPAVQLASDAPPCDIEARRNPPSNCRVWVRFVKPWAARLTGEVFLPDAELELGRVDAGMLIGSGFAQLAPAAAERAA